MRRREEPPTEDAREAARRPERERDARRRPFHLRRARGRSDVRGRRRVDDELRRVAEAPRLDAVEEGFRVGRRRRHAERVVAPEDQRRAASVREAPEALEVRFF